MACTKTIQNTINWAAAFLVQRPQTGVGQTNPNEPALTTANYIMSTVLAAPFKWEWNRATKTFVTVAGTTDYPVAVSDFGYLEKATIFNSNSNPKTMELEIHKILAADDKQNPPRRLAILLDDNAGNITFRLFPNPDAIYTVTLTYQKAPVLASGLNTTWAPIPDKLDFLYERGYLAQMQMMYNQQLGLSNLEIFFRQLVGAAEGLTEAEKDIFLSDALRPIRQRQSELLATQQGRQSRQ